MIKDHDTSGADQSMQSTAQNTTTDSQTLEENDLQRKLDRVLGTLESNIELRKHSKTTEISGIEHSEVDLESNFLEEARNVSILIIFSWHFHFQFSKKSCDDREGILTK